jgi:hypothetical protein
MAGRLVPVGTGFRTKKEIEEDNKIRAKEDAAAKNEKNYGK